MTGGIERVHGEKGDTWPQILKYNYEKYGHGRRAMRRKHRGIWQPYTWQDYYLGVKFFALGLLSLGLEPGGRVLIIGDNSPQWYHAALAAQAVHGTSVGVYSDSLPSEVRYFAENCDAQFAVAQDQEQVDKLLQIKEELPLLKRVIYWSYKGLSHYDDPFLIGYNQVLRLGKKYEENHPGAFERNVEAGRPEDVCAIIYTSGTTGAAPKGVLHTYGTLRSSADCHLALDPWHEDDNVLPHLPPVWIAEQWFGIGCHLLSGSILNFAETPETQQRDMRESEPSIVCYGARLWESQAAGVQARILSADRIKRFVFRLFMPIAYRAADLRFQKTPPGLFWKMLHATARAVLLKPVRRSLGLSNARICYSTGATLSPEALRFYHALNVPLKILYGSTEGGALTGPGKDDIGLDTVGPPHKGIDLKIDDNGEVICRGPGVFLGYHKDPAMTAGVLKDGWFYTGDSGVRREDGHVALVDRARDLSLLHNGEVLAPQKVESRLRCSPYIKDAWVLAGPEGAYVSAVIIINYDVVAGWAGQRGVSFAAFADLSQTREVYDLIGREVEKVNRSLPRGAGVRKYVNYYREFDPDEGELTRNGKLRRTVLLERCRELVEGIYMDRDEVLIETHTGAPEGQTGTAKTVVGVRVIGGDA